MAGQILISFVVIFIFSCKQSGKRDRDIPLESGSENQFSEDKINLPESEDLSQIQTEKYPEDPILIYLHDTDNLGLTEDSSEDSSRIMTFLQDNQNLILGSLGVLATGAVALKIIQKKGGIIANKSNVSASGKSTFQTMRKSAPDSLKPTESAIKTTDSGVFKLSTIDSSLDSITENVLNQGNRSLVTVEKKSIASLESKGFKKLADDRDDIYLYEGIRYKTIKQNDDMLILRPTNLTDVSIVRRGKQIEVDKYKKGVKQDKKVGSEHLAYTVGNPVKIEIFDISKQMKMLDIADQNRITKLKQDDKVQFYELDDGSIKFVTHLSSGEAALAGNLDTLKSLSLLKNQFPTRAVSITGDLNINTFGAKGPKNVQDIADQTDMVVLTGRHGVKVNRPDDPFRNAQFAIKSEELQTRETMGHLFSIPKDMTLPEKIQFIEELKIANPDLNIAVPKNFGVDGYFKKGDELEAFSRDHEALQYRDHIPIKAVQVTYNNGKFSRLKAVVADNHTTILDKRKGFVTKTDWDSPPSTEVVELAAKLGRESVDNLYKALQKKSLYADTTLKKSDTLKNKAQSQATKKFNLEELKDGKYDIVKAEVRTEAIALMKKLRDQKVLATHKYKSISDEEITKLVDEKMIGKMMENISRSDKLSIDYYTNILFTSLNSRHVGGQIAKSLDNAKDMTPDKVLKKQLDYINTNYNDSVVFAVEANGVLSSVKKYTGE